MFDDEIWDEHRWEDFLSESDRRTARRLGIFFDYLADHPRPDEQGEERERWALDFRQMLLDKGFREDDPLMSLINPADEDDDEPRWDEEDFEDALFDDDFDDEEVEPEQPLEEVPVYAHALDLSVDLLRWSNALPVAEKDSTFVHFCANVTQIPANLAKGHGIGFEKEMIGGNIACVKRGLQAANEALTLLSYLKGEAYLPEARYRELYERLFEIRNEIGLYVQALRERFDLGID